MARITIDLGPHELNPNGSNTTHRVDEDAMIKVMVPKGDGPVLKRAGDVAPPDRVCLGPGVCLPVL